MLEGSAIVDLNYEEDKAVTVDFNLVATEDGEFVEVQGSGEEATFAQSQLDQMLALGAKRNRRFDRSPARSSGADHGFAAGDLSNSGVVVTTGLWPVSNVAQRRGSGIICSSHIVCFKARSPLMKKALITGITGQDGSYLADLLLEKGYEVHGIIRRASTFNTSRIDHLYADPHINGVRMFLHYGDLSDSVNLVKLLYDLKPDEIYHLAAQSHVRVSFDIPEYTSDVTGVGTIRILEAIREVGLRSRFYQASSSEMFGKAQQVPQSEKTPFWPRSPYGVAKVFSYWATVNYRESYGLTCEQRDSLQSRKSASR